MRHREIAAMLAILFGMLFFATLWIGAWNIYHGGSWMEIPVFFSCGIFGMLAVVCGSSATDGGQS
jgi:hypothetical protein